ncbi:hypothetical protein [Aliikangiella sp. G2MR2-5]|uniref:hypothetical protein n=1 Tax=Aliikangiella sp. G2MR2-5 TaxID=2788943 RepID=UPI0018AC476F|nr:hypothetical protein [Aliikangiella sp. G2MR2-5]
MILEPEKDWGRFESSDDVVEFIATELKLSENDGIWQYYNFDECSSVWCSAEIGATNQLNLKFDSNKPDAKIRRIGIELTNNAGIHFKQLFRLKRELKSRFGIREA